MSWLYWFLWPYVIKSNQYIHKLNGSVWWGEDVTKLAVLGTIGCVLEVCWDIGPAAYAAGLLQQAIKRAYYDLVPDLSAEGSPANA